MTRLRWFRSEIGGSTNLRLRWYRSEFSGVASTTKIRWYRSEFSGTLSVLVSAIPDLSSVEPEIVISVVANLQGGGTADSWSWRIVSGSVVTLNTNGPNLTFTAPSNLNGTSFVIGVTATIAGITSPEELFTVSVLPQTEWFWDEGASSWVGQRYTYA